MHGRTCIAPVIQHRFLPSFYDYRPWGQRLLQRLVYLREYFHPSQGGQVVDPVDVAAVEGDPRFPSGAWTGFYLQWWMPGRHMMAIDLTFARGRLEASGSDFVGPFTFEGDYNPVDGECRWSKVYLGRHQVSYTGINEGEGICGIWEIRQLGGLYRDQGVFHIWPRGMTPTEAAEATVQAYLSHLRSRGLKRLFGLGVGAGLILAIVFLIRYLFTVP
jgi:hypothetical protein